MANFTGTSNEMVTNEHLSLDIACDNSDITEISSHLRNLSTENILLKEINVIKENCNDNIMVRVNPQPHHFDILKLVGEGAFGKVFVVKNALNQEIYAMKVISKKLLRKKNNIQYMKSEREILTKTNHPFVTSLRYAFQSETKLYLVMDFLSGGELFFHLKRIGLILERDARFYFCEMILAIEFLHSINIIHRDLKPENVLLRSDGHICITDFGLAKEIGDQANARTLCGTSEYMAPEMLVRNGYGKGVDWWSLGALFYEIMTGKPPFRAPNQKDLDRKILTEKVSFPSFLSTNSHSLLKGMLEKDVNKRLGASKSTMFSLGGVSALKKHVFFEGIDWVVVQHLQYSPPIDFSSLSLTSKGNLSPIATSNSQLNGLDSLTLNFANDFTDQDISRSIVEESLSGMNSPDTRSRVNSHEFDDFEYFHAPLECPRDVYLDFESKLANKLNKLEKKKNLRAKKEEQKNGKLNLEKELKQQEEIAQERDKLKFSELKKLKLNLDSFENEYHLKKLEYDKTVKNRLEENEKLLSIGRKVKAVRKKLREITDLELKLVQENSESSRILTPEQQAKLEKKNVLNDEAAVLEDLVEKTKLVIDSLPDESKILHQIGKLDDMITSVKNQLSENSHFFLSYQDKSPTDVKSNSSPKKKEQKKRI